MPRHSGQVPISTKNNRAARHAHARAREEFKTYDTSAIRPRQSKAPMIIALIVILVALAVIIAVVIRGCNYENETLPPTQEAVVIVEEGQSAKEVASTLLKEKLIGNEQEFMSLIESKNAAGSIIPGTYLFKGGTSNDKILSALMTGPASTADTLTIPEGMTRAEIAAAVEEATLGRITAQDFLDASDDAEVYAPRYDFLEGIGEVSLEGFLFPKTYSITATDDAVAVVRMMLDQFREEVMSMNMAYPSSRNMSVYDVVKLASIVQKEGTPDTFTTIASVFYNRLASNSPYLQSDVTTAYEVGHEPSGEEVHADTPYSTYAHEGLPPTPICSPSIEAFQAVCAPEETDYMFFYAYDDGTIAFSKTYDEHKAAIQ